MFHPPQPPPHYLPAPPPHHAPVHSRHYPSTPLQLHQPPPHQYPPSPHPSYPRSPHPHPRSPAHPLPPPPPPPHHAPPRHAYPHPPPPYSSTPRPYHPPPSHRFPQAGPSRQPQYPNPQPRSRIPPAPHSAPAKMDLAQWFDNDSDTGCPSDFMFNFDQPSPTPKTGPMAMLPRMTTSQSSTSLGGYIAQGPAQTASSANIMTYPWGPKEGWAGSQLCIKIDVNAEAIMSAGNSPDRMVLLIGDYMLQTNNRVLNGGYCRVQGGQIRVLSATIPEYGQGLEYQSADSLPVYIQVLDGQSGAAEKLHVGSWTFVVPQAMFGAFPMVKREGDLLENERNQPQWTEHRRAASLTGSNASVLAAPYGSQTMYINAPSPNMSAWSHSPFGQGPMLPAHHANWPQHLALTPCLQPQLMRSSQLPASSHANLYDAPKAELSISGDMGMMAKGWSNTEWATKRRLVKIWRRQEGSVIYIAFGPIPQNEWQAAKDSVVVSCIFRDDKNSCWITSVDMLYLLEAVIGQRFTVEEKNRIRRNLEGFRPQTVSKNKPSSDAFFRTIMNFPQPKPRNIEKDVKVFPWECVAASLKKIVGKYTATTNENGEPILWHPPSGDAGSTIALPNVRDNYPRPAVTYNQSSVYTPPSEQSALPQVPGIPIDPSLMDLPGNMIPNMHQAPQMHTGTMQPSGSASGFGPQSIAMRTSVQQAGAHWDQTIGGSFRTYTSPPAPPGMTISHSSSNTAQTEYPSPPLGYYMGGPPPLAGPGCNTASAAPMMGSDIKVGTSPLDTQLVQSQSNTGLDVTLQPSTSDLAGVQDAMTYWAQQSAYDLNQAPIHSFDDYKPAVGTFGQSNDKTFVDQPMFTAKE